MACFFSGLCDTAFWYCDLSYLVHTIDSSMRDKSPYLGMGEQIILRNPIKHLNRKVKLFIANIFHVSTSGVLACKLMSGIRAVSYLCVLTSLQHRHVIV